MIVAKRTTSPDGPSRAKVSGMTPSAMAEAILARHANGVFPPSSAIDRIIAGVGVKAVIGPVADVIDLNGVPALQVPPSAAAWPASGHRAVTVAMALGALLMGYGPRPFSGPDKLRIRKQSMDFAYGLLAPPNTLPTDRFFDFEGLERLLDVMPGFLTTRMIELGAM